MPAPRYVLHRVRSRRFFSMWDGRGRPVWGGFGLAQSFENRQAAYEMAKNLNYCVWIERVTR